MRMDDACALGDIFNYGPQDAVMCLRERHMRRMKHMAIVCTSALRLPRSKSKSSGNTGGIPSNRRWISSPFPMAGALFVLAEGRLVNLGARPAIQFRHVQQLYQPGAGANRIVHARREISLGVYVLPKCSMRKSPDCTWPAGCPARIADSEAVGVSWHSPPRPLKTDSYRY